MPAFLAIFSAIGLAPLFSPYHVLNMVFFGKTKTRPNEDKALTKGKSLLGLARA